jgi:hypothetical protein
MENKTKDRVVLFTEYNETFGEMSLSSRH